MKKIITMILMFTLVFTLVMPATAEAKATPKLNKTRLTLTITQKKTKPTYKLKVKKTIKKIRWKTSNKKVATVSSIGKVTAKKKGNAVITAKVGKRTLRCKVTVKDTRKVKTPPSKTKKCNHVYEDHWTTFEEYYEYVPNAWRGSCYCGVFNDEDSYRQHVFEVSVYRGANLTKEERQIGVHGNHVKAATGVKIINGKQYAFIKTEYIDKRTCTKCGKVLENVWDTPEAMKSNYPNGRMTPVDPYAAPVAE